MTEAELAAVWEQYSSFYGWDSVEAFQRFFGLLATGVFDESTAAAVQQPRCGLRDNLVVFSEAKWRKRELTWFARRYLNGLPQAEQDNIFDEAWQSWGRVCDLRFRKAGSIAQADIILDVGSGRPDGFDGPSGTLAWMTLGTNNDNPILGRFDLAEQWVNDPNRDIYLLAVAAHEFGHALNLDHAPQRSGALMAPYYSRRVFKPQQHDIDRVQALYGPPTGAPSPTPTPQPTPTPTPSPTPGGGFMRELVDLVVTAIIAYLKQSLPFIGRFLEGQKDRIVDFIMRRFGLGLTAPAQIDVEGLGREMLAEIGAPPTQ